MKGTLFVLSAPSGTGKTTILKEIIGPLPRIAFSISHTTRRPRKGEQNGVDYYFVDKKTFMIERQAGSFLEWAEVHGNFYGTSKSAVLNQLNQGYDIVLDIDVQGARQLRKQKIDAVFVFISPPSWEDLKKRLSGRGTDDESTIKLRLHNARKEMEDASLYDYLIINDTVKNAVEVLRSVIIEKRARGGRRADGSPLHLPEISS